MEKLFVFQDEAEEDYRKELECAFNICKHEKKAQRVNLNEIAAEHLEKSPVDVVISNRLPIEWYLILRGLKIVTITLDSNEDNRNHSDITIDYKSDDILKYFTGESHSICRNGYRVDYFVEIFNLATVLQWDSQFFGFPVAYLSSRHLTESVVYRVEKFVKEKDIKLVEYKCDCHDRRSVRIAEKEGYEFKDIRLTYEKLIRKKSILNLVLDWKLDWLKNGISQG